MRRFILAASFAALLAGCAATPKIHYYLLDAPRVSVSATAPTIHIVTLSVPELVDRPQMVVQGAEQRVEILDTSRWAQPLRSSVAQVLAAHLAQASGSAAVFTPGQGSAVAADYRIAVDIQRFDSAPGTASIEALWTVRRKGAAQPLTGRSSIRETLTGSDPAAYAAAHSRALGKVAVEIAAVLR